MKNHLKASGIYCFLNWTNNKVYIGSAINLYNRRKNHLVALRLNKHFNRYLQAAWNKYGEQNFTFIVLEFVPNLIDLIEREQLYIDKFKSFNREKGYNLSPTAGSPLGVKHSEETIAKYSETRKGMPHSIEWNINVSKALTGKKATDIAKHNISKALTGRKLSNEHAEKIGNYKRNLEKYPCPKGYYCACEKCKDKRAEITRQYRIRKSQMENK